MSPFHKSEAKEDGEVGRGWRSDPQELFSQQKILKFQVGYIVSDFPRIVWWPALDMMGTQPASSLAFTDSYHDKPSQGEKRME